MIVSRAASEPAPTPLPRRAAGAVTVVVLVAGAIGLTAGLPLAVASPGTITGTVFLDGDGDGERDGDEPGIEGVAVVAVDAQGNRSLAASTDGSGIYEIDLGAAEGEPLGDGPYRVEFSDWSPQLNETPMGPDSGSAVQFVDAHAAGVSLGLGTAPPVVGNRVWLDLDGDGGQDADEPGIGGVTVELRSADGDPVERVTTDSAGRWQAMPGEGVEAIVVDPADATGLPDGIAPADLVPTRPRLGDPRFDSDMDADGGLLLDGDAGGTGHGLGLDAGFTVPATAPALTVEKSVVAGDGRGELVAADATGPGAGVAWYRPGTPLAFSIRVTNPGPDDLGGVEVVDPAAPDCERGPFDLPAGATETWSCTLVPGPGSSGVVATATASARWIPSRGPGAGEVQIVTDDDDAVVRIVSPAVGISVAVAPAGPHRSGAEVVYAYAVRATGDVDLDLGSPVRLVDDGCDTVTDAAFHPVAGAPFNAGDLDADGILDVEADTSAGDDALGDDALGAETWQFACTATVDRQGPLTTTATVLATPVSPDGSPIGLRDVSRQDSTTIVIDDGNSVPEDLSAPVTAAPLPEPSPEPATIGDRVWHDIDADGVQDDGEPGFAGVAVALVDGDGATIARTTTGPDGAFLFPDVAPGVVRLDVDVPEGFRASPADRGHDDAVDSDVAADGRGARTTLDAGEDDRSWDAGIHTVGVIGGRVWNDRDGDGVREDGEPDLAGVTVRLLDGAGNTAASTRTGADGGYVFSGLQPGDHRVEFVTPVGMVTVPARAAGAAVDSDLDPATDRTPAISLGSGEQALGWDAGFMVPTVVLSAPEINAAAAPAALAITGRSIYTLVGLATMLLGAGGTFRILSDRVARPAQRSRAVVTDR